MTLSTKKDAKHTSAVKIKGKTYFCCAECGAHKPAATKTKKIAAAAMAHCDRCAGEHAVAKQSAHRHAIKAKAACCAPKAKSQKTKST
jgi:transcription elongation factor Elf1